MLSCSRLIVTSISRRSLLFAPLSSTTQRPELSSLKKCDELFLSRRSISRTAERQDREKTREEEIGVDKKPIEEKIKATEVNSSRGTESGPNEQQKQRQEEKKQRRTKRLVLFGVVGLSSWLLGKYYINQDHKRAVVLYRKLPLRSMSRAWGEINSIDLPTWCRKPCFYFYSWMFSCNLDEIDIDDLNQYKNLSEFFRRALKPDARIIHHSLLVSPCDGKILHFGQVEKGMLEQVKGVNYALQAFLGDQTWPKNTVKKPTTSRSRYSLSSSSSSSDDEVRSISSNLSDSGISDDGSNSGESPEAYEKSILYHPEENCLYHCVIYLAPGDYHRFHSPTDWQVFARRHFPGELFSVNPSVARWLQGLFNFNERVVYYGEWQHGFFSMTAVGATNVGSIRVYMDDGMTTNKKAKNLDESDLEKNFSKFDTQSDSIKGVEIKKGENFGEFNLGSTIVLIFEAPKDFKFDVNQSEKVFFGCKLGGSPSYPDRDEQTKL